MFSVKVNLRVRRRARRDQVEIGLEEMFELIFMEVESVVVLVQKKTQGEQIIIVQVLNYPRPGPLTNSG
jgi:ribosomal protein L23